MEDNLEEIAKKTGNPVSLIEKFCRGFIRNFIYLNWEDKK
jgi:hypothetical protein